MEKKESENLFDYHKEELGWFFTFDKEKVGKLLDAINNDGVNVSLKKISKVTELDFGMGEVGRLYSGLAAIAHNLYSHTEIFEKELAVCYLNDNQKKELKNFLSKLNDNGIHGLNLRYNTRYVPRDNILEYLGGDVILKQIVDENDKVIGYLPLLKMTAMTTEEDGNPKSVSFELDFDRIEQLMESMNMLKKDFINFAKDYKNKLGDDLILPEEK